MRNHSYDLHQPTDSFHDNQTHFYIKGFTQRLVLKQRHKDTFIHELLTGAFDFTRQQKHHYGMTLICHQYQEPLDLSSRLKFVVWDQSLDLCNNKLRLTTNLHCQCLVFVGDIAFGFSVPSGL